MVSEPQNHFFSDLYVRFFCNLFLTTLEVFAPLSGRKDKKSVSFFRTKSTVHEPCPLLPSAGVLKVVWYPRIRGLGRKSHFFETAKL